MCELFIFPFLQTVVRKKSTDKLEATVDPANSDVKC